MSETTTSKDELRRALAEALGMPRSPHSRFRVVEAILPVVLAERERHARQRAAEELRAAASGIEAANWASARVLIRYRADTLASEATP